MVSNHFGAKVVTQCRGALPTFPLLTVFNYLSLISWSLGGLFRTAVTSGGRMVTSVRARRSLPDASCGRHLREECRLARWGVLKGKYRFPQGRSRVFLFPFCSFSSSGVGSPLPVFLVKMPLCTPVMADPRMKTVVCVCGGGCVWGPPGMCVG